ncbi:Scd6-like Sm domain-containing protein [Trichophaea hybrida]|nr:Scd6-like Sm domain-containing protein [Trichophaea hybrida]
MTEFIGARISLISKSNIRYVGTLHEINSETSTVALEQVTSHGTEGRRGGEGEIAGSENVYEYIVFRGSDVKDLRIEEPAQKKPQMPPPQLDDPAILGQSSRPYAQPPAPFQHQQQQPPPPMGVPPYYFPHPQQQRGFGPSPYQTSGMFGAYPPPPGGQPPMGMTASGMPPQQQQQQSPPQQPPQQSQQSQQPPQQSQQHSQSQKAPQQQPQQPPPTGPHSRAPPQAPIGPSANRQIPGPASRQPQGVAPSVQAPKPQEKPSTPITNGPVPVQQRQKAESVSAQPKPTEQSSAAAPNAVTQAPSKAPTGPKARGGIVPALPLTSPARTVVVPATPSNNVSVPPVSTIKDDATVSANAANAAVRDLADKVNRLAVSAGSAAAKTNTSANVNPAETTPPTTAPTTAAVTANQQSRPRQPGNGNFIANRGNRGGYRGGFNNQNRKVEVPTTDYDFQFNNDKFNKQDLVKEAIASGAEENTPHVSVSAPVENSTNGDGAADIVIPPAPKESFYNRKSGFFDNISCENKERAEAVPGERRGGAQFRSEEQKKNLETFGQGSVDGGYSGYRGGWRGRGRGRGGFRGRGFSYGGANGGYRRQQAQTGTAGN